MLTLESSKDQKGANSWQLTIFTQEFPQVQTSTAGLSTSEEGLNGPGRANSDSGWKVGILVPKKKNWKISAIIIVILINIIPINITYHYP